MRRTITGLLSVLFLLSMAACSPKDAPDSRTAEEVSIALSDDGVTVDGKSAGTEGAVRVGGEMIYYRDGTGKSYGEGSADEKHSAEEAEAHTLVTITQPGTYRVSGTLSRGQLFVDLGPGAESNPDAVVTLILDNADITCTVAPAVFFYRVYECGPADSETAGPEVDTYAAGANVVLTAGSQNHITGSHVAKIYKDGTTDKLHKYDGAFYSRMSMNIDSEPGDAHGALYITGDHEGLDSELHLTVNGGVIFIDADNDGINANADGVSVVTVNGGMLTVNGGLGEEGDGIDSNGYLTVNGGTVWATSNEKSPDGGIDADCAITVNGGSVSAFGTRNDSVSGDGTQPSMELSFAETLPAGTDITVLRENNDPVFSFQLARACRSVTLSDGSLALGETYQVLVNGRVQTHSTAMMGGPGGMRPPEEGRRPELPAQDPEDRPEPPMVTDRPEPVPPEELTPPEGEPGDLPEAPEGVEPSRAFVLETVNARFENVKDASSEETA